MASGDDTDYTSAWAEYRRRRRVWCALTISLFPGAVAVAWAVRLVRAPEEWFVGYAICAMTCWFVTWLRLAGWRCPRCGNRYFRVRGLHNPFARRCLHCGLPRWASPADAGPAKPTSAFSWLRWARDTPCAAALGVGAFFGLCFPAALAAAWLQVRLFGARDQIILYKLMASHTAFVAPSGLLLAAAARSVSHGSSRARLVARLALVLLLVTLGAFIVDGLGVMPGLIDDFGKEGPLRTAMQLASRPLAILTALPVAVLLCYLFFALRAEGQSSSPELNGTGPGESQLSTTPPAGGNDADEQGG